MSAVTQKTDKLFMDATLSDDDLGYPDGVEFVPADEPWTEDVLWRTLTEGIPALLVFESDELLLVPLRRSALDRVQGRVPVRVAPRANGRPGAYATRSRLGRRPLAEMRKLAHA